MDKKSDGGQLKKFTPFLPERQARESTLTNMLATLLQEKARGVDVGRKEGEKKKNNAKKAASKKKNYPKGNGADRTRTCAGRAHCISD